MSKRSVRKFWLLDYDPEGEIYETLSWDLPGFRPVRGDRPGSGRVPKTNQSRK